jgi:hypothetical protein
MVVHPVKRVSSTVKLLIIKGIVSEFWQKKD